MNPDFSRIRHFAPSEFPEGELPFTEQLLLETLDTWREAIGKPIHPSPVKGALARPEIAEGSEHAAKGRKSRAVDVFPEGNWFDAWISAVSFNGWGAVGVYFDTHFQDRPWAMLHLDIRPRGPNGPLLWARIEKTQYVYPGKNPAERRLFQELLSRGMV